MGVLPQPKVEKLGLPTSKGKPEAEQEWVEINTNPLGGDIVDALDTPDATSAERTRAMLAKLITAWSFTLPDGSAAPITPDNIRNLEFEDQNFLAGFIAPKLEALPGGGEDGKKSSVPSSSTSSPNGTAAG